MSAAARPAPLAIAPAWLPLVAGLAAFATYSSMYAFRKPFTAAAYADLAFLGVDYKVWLVVAQLVGYAASKFWGIRFVAELPPARRARTILVLIASAGLALVGFAVLPPALGIVCLFANGLPLGLIWGLVFGYLEGRRSTELMGAILASSFIFASGVVKSVGKALLLAGVGEFWMPALTGLVFLPPLLVALSVLARMPPPDAADVAARSERGTMDRAARRRFLREYLPGFACTVPIYVLLTALRDFRESFDTEIWADLGYGHSAAIFTAVDAPIGVAVLALTATLCLVRDNLRALMWNHVLVGAGFAIAGAATLAFDAHRLSGLAWMTLVGFGLYLAYVPFNCMFYERVMATFRVAGTSAFMMYVADASGYVASVGVLVARQFAALDLSWTRFFAAGVNATAFVGLALTVLSAAYFRRKALRQRNVHIAASFHTAAFRTEEVKVS